MMIIGVQDEQYCQLGMSMDISVVGHAILSNCLLFKLAVTAVVLHIAILTLNINGTVHT